jgi:tetratricopeptide (TPR) repeat protein
MLKLITCLGCALAIYLAVPLLHEVGLPGSVALAAEDDEDDKPARQTRRVPSMSEATYKKLSEAQEAIDAKDYATAKQVLNDMLERASRLNGNEIGQVHNMLGFVHFSDENYAEALRSYEKVLAQGEDIPEGLEVQTLYTMAQLSFVDEQYQKALDYMQQWIAKAENPGADPHIFMGQVYYQMENFPAAIQQIEQGISIAKERNLEVKENWWALLNFLYYEQENWPKVLEILEILVRDFPKRDYWIRLAGIHAQQGNDKESLWTYEAADAGGFLTQQSDLTNYSGTLMQAELPWRAALVMDRGLKDEVIERTDTTLQQLGQAWQLAQEVDKAIPVLEEAARLSDEGRIYERLAPLYYDNDQLKECVDAADGALEKGELRAESAVHQIRGMCLSDQDKKSDARKAFVTCRTVARREDDDTNQRICQQWIRYLDNEEEREETLRRASL